KRWEVIRSIEHEEMGELNRAMEDLRLEKRRLEMDGAKPEAMAELEDRDRALWDRYERVSERLNAVRAENERAAVSIRLADGRERSVRVADIVRTYQPNALGVWGKIGIYCEKGWEFVAGQPRESNTEGGIFPALFGTVMMVMLMSLAAVPFGILAALYLREYAKQGLFVRLVRIAVNNLAGVPSIVFGMFGLGFFVYGVGGSIDRLFYPEALPTPTYGTGGILWASLTLALLTVPVVIVATEEALAAVPRELREGALGLGSTKFQMIWNVVLPSALPGILTGVILATARGAGEVAPLMITGVVKLAPDLPLDAYWPFFHLERKFMHLGFHIYDVGFQSPNVEAARPMVYTTALLLLLIVLALNLTAIVVRNKLRRRYASAAF
ncbi:MAG: phosphate ABC transporter permease PstA, partial [Candidatus Latescibacterota bacterium]